MVGSNVAVGRGDMLGAWETVGTTLAVGTSLGDGLGSTDGCKVGLPDGATVRVGRFVGRNVASAVGLVLG